MIDIVGTKSLPDQFLEEIGFLVRALGRAEAGKRLSAIACVNGFQTGGRRAQAPPPTSPRGTRSRDWRGQPASRHPCRRRRADQRLCQAMRVMNLVESEAALDAQAVVVGWPIAAIDITEFVVLDVRGGLATTPQ